MIVQGNYTRGKLSCIIVAAEDAATHGRKDLLVGVSSRSMCETKFGEALTEKREIDPSQLALVNTLAG